MQTKTRVIKTPDDLDKLRRELTEKSKKVKKSVRVCIGTGCAAKGANRIYELFCNAVKESGKDIIIEAKCTGCHGLCQCGPVVVINPGEILYLGVKEADVEIIFRETIQGDKIIERLLYEDAQSHIKTLTDREIPFYKEQKRIVLKGNGIINPRDIMDYLNSGGYSALVKALTTMKPDEIITEVEKSGLRGRGGGGFKTAKKWQSCKNARGDIKYVIGNGDEGDPGAFMDCYIMEGNPHSIIEGMIIGAYAIGANSGYIYVRNEYPLAVKHLEIAVEQAESIGLLGENILGTGFNFDIKINRGGGAFVCGESTALMASLEGKTGEPRAKYVHTAESGLYNRPTNLNNVETWANIPAIILMGGDEYAKTGTQGSKGTKAFSLAGKVVNTGLIEVPMGTPLGKIIFDIGGGINGGKAFKAVQTGGPSGGCIPKEFLDVPVDFDELTRLGSMMGSGGMIVMDEETCMVSIARYFLSFLKYESCGKCTPCREGIPQMLHILNRITSGKGREGDIELLNKLATLLADSSLCALGKTAANPVLSTLRFFKDEYEAHIKEKKCPAKECKGLFRYSIDNKKCNGCQVCLKNCPAEAITGERGKPHKIIQNKCTLCGICMEKCKHNAVIKV